jgi:hypothetical protein
MRLGLSVATTAGLVHIPFQAHITLLLDQIGDPDDHCSYRQPSRRHSSRNSKRSLTFANAHVVHCQSNSHPIIAEH